MVALTKIKTKNELIGEVISLLQSPIQRVIGALQNRPEAADTSSPVAITPEASAKTELAPETTNTEPTADAAQETKPEA